MAKLLTVDDLLAQSLANKSPILITGQNKKGERVAAVVAIHDEPNKVNSFLEMYESWEGVAYPRKTRIFREDVSKRKILKSKG